MRMLTLFLMSKKGYKVLEFLVSKYPYLIQQVIAAEDKYVENDFYREIKSLCKCCDLKFFNALESYETPRGYSIAISWRWIIKDYNNLIIVHDSILPKYRGFAPLVNSLKNGESTIGVTAIFAQEGYDTGEIICSDSIEVSYPIKIAAAIDIITICYINVIDFICERIIENKGLPSIPQDHKEATYSLWLNEDDYKISWKNDAEEIHRFINAVGFPYSGAYTYMNGTKVRILEAEVVPDVIIENRTPGKVIFIEHSLPIIVCGKGLLRVCKMFFDDGTNALPLKQFRTIFN